MEKTESVDTVISMVEETILLTQVEMSPAGRANEEMETDHTDVEIVDVEKDAKA